VAHLDTGGCVSADVLGVGGQEFLPVDDVVVNDDSRMEGRVDFPLPAAFLFRYVLRNK
jgi:hypothetical protein